MVDPTDPESFAQFAAQAHQVKNPRTLLTYLTTYIEHCSQTGDLAKDRAARRIVARLAELTGVRQ